MGPLGSRGQNNRTRPRNFPIAFRIAQRAALVGDPTMAKDFQLKVGDFIEIGFEGDGLFLLSPYGKKPLHWNWAGPKAEAVPPGEVLAPTDDEAFVAPMITVASPPRMLPQT